MKSYPLFALKEGVTLVLASASPRRRQFLEEWGLAFLVRPAKAEPSPFEGEDPKDYVLRSAKAKLDALPPNPGELVVAADTVVAVDGRILGKPSGEAEALSMLESLAGREHAVMTAVALRYPDSGIELFADVCLVRFHPWSRAVLSAYVATGECRDKAGAYAIQGQGAFLVESISGSWSTVVGLPVTLLAEKLLGGGWIAPFAGGR